MSDIAAIADGLTEAQRKAIYPGPGNPEYARGHVSSMKSLGRIGVVDCISAFAINGMRGGHLTPLGRQVRAYLMDKSSSEDK